MPITFAVDDVAPATSAPRTRPFGDVVGEVLALGVDRSLRVVDGPRTHPLLGAVHLAFAEHRPLVLSPDAIWITIAQGLARHVRLHADALRGRLVRHEGTKRLEVRHAGPFPTDPAGIASLVDPMRAKVAEEVGEGPARLFVCDFSTTTSIERTASEIVLLDAYSPFFDYALMCVCGIPSITLTGTVEDWQSIRKRIDALGDLVRDTGLPSWPGHLRTIVDRLIDAASGRPDRAFFQRIYKPKDAYGGEKVTGWIAWLYPYLGIGGRYDTLNPLLAHAPEGPLPGEDRARDPNALGPDWWTGPSIDPSTVPADLAECRFAVTDLTRVDQEARRFDVTLRGGLACIAVDERGALSPSAAWWCARSTPSIDETIERLRELGVKPAPKGESQYAHLEAEVSELGALRRALGTISLFDGRVVVPEPAYPVQIGQHVHGLVCLELEGSHAVFTYRGFSAERVYALVPSSAIAPERAGDRERGVMSPRAIQLSVVDIPVIGRSLAEVLAAALDARGIPDLPRRSLFHSMDASRRIPRTPFVSSRPIVPQHQVPLATRTTLELGGAAAQLVSVRAESELVAALLSAEQQKLPAFVLGGGSNLIVPDGGYDGVVLSMEMRGIATLPAENAKGERTMRVTAAAGEPWDEFVAFTVQNGWQGLECLSGIPGLVGATPVQNVGAYGQDVSETVCAVGVVDRDTKQTRTLTPEECQFAYRDSALKREPTRYVVTWVCFELRPNAPPAVKYAELQKALADKPSPTLTDVRETVIALRKKKSMVIDAFDPNRRSAGSFFTNPIVTADVADEVVKRAIERGTVKSAADVPRWPERDGRVKLAAGWLIERSGIEKGLRMGNVGISSAHALALVHHGGGTTKELLALADHVVRTVREAFGVELEREPVLMR